MPLLLITPGAELLVAAWRAEHDWAARYGIPAHVTVRTPFLAPDRWRDPRLEALRQLLPVQLSLARLENRPGALVVLVEPDAELRRVSDAVGELWPELPPHRAEHAHVAYHVTVVRTADALVRARALKAIAPQLPLDVTGIELWAAHGSPDRGARHAVVASAR